MTPRRRTRRAAGVVVLGVTLSTVVLACGPLASYGTAGPSYAARKSSASSPPSPSGVGEPSWAGSKAGEGRLRPGRPEEPGEETARPSGTGADDVSASPSASDSATEEDVQAVPDADPSGPVLRILPLGSGLVLIGLGLGLAFVALRVRRVQG